MYICLWETMMQYFEIIEVYVCSCVCVCVCVQGSVSVTVFPPWQLEICWFGFWEDLSLNYKASGWLEIIQCD